MQSAKTMETLSEEVDEGIGDHLNFALLLTSKYYTFALQMK